MSDPTEPSRPDVIILMTDQERAAPPYETDALSTWRHDTLRSERWFAEHGVTFRRHYTGSLACVPSRPTLFTGQYPDVHGVTQTDGLGKTAADSRMRWLREGEVPTLGHWFRAAGYDTHYDGKWHISHADLHDADGSTVATNDNEGVVDAAAVQRYLDADPLDAFGFSGWVGPEPHGASLANAGVRRDPLIAARVCAWLDDRYARRRAGDADALRPFLLVASFVNPHDIVLFPLWQRLGSPLDEAESPPPSVPAPPTANEDLADKPAAQIAYREAYPSGYGPPPAVNRLYRRNEQAYRDLYYRLHAEVDAPVNQVLDAALDNDGSDAVIVRTADHGELLGAHGGLHQKWFNLYDEATRVPFTIARIGSRPTVGREVADTPTSHVDLVPTLLAAARVDVDAEAERLSAEFSEVHPLPGRSLMGFVDDDPGDDADRSVYLMTRDNILEGDTGLNGVGRRMGRTPPAPLPFRIQVPAHVPSNFEGLVGRVAETGAAGGAGHLWKIVRTFDDPATWTEPHVRHLAATGPAGNAYRTEPLPDQWELYDLDDDPVEAINRADDPAADAVRRVLVQRLADERSRCCPPRHATWNYAERTPPGGARRGSPKRRTPPRPALALRGLLQRVGMHPDDDTPTEVQLDGRRALVVATNHGVLDVGKPTGVFASELTVPYYAFLDAGMAVDVASPRGGVIPVDPLSLRPILRTADDDRLLADDDLRAAVGDSLAIGEVNIAEYDLVYLAGGWGAAFDFGTSDELARQVTAANAAGLVIGGVCHGPLGLRNATDVNGSPLVEGRRVSAVTDKQVSELGIGSTPQHPETELRRMGARFESETKFRDPLANHWVVDGNLVTGQNQNAGPMVAREMLRLVAEHADIVVLDDLVSTAD